jgi:hypothetical protein
LKLTESPYFDPTDDIVSLSFFLTAPDITEEAMIEAYNTAPENAYLDIDKIEFVKLDEIIPAPVITDFNPKRGRRGIEVIIEGSGFAQPADRNVVTFRDIRQEILSGDSTHLVVKMNAGDRDSIHVLTPGGGRATSAVPFIFVGRPCRILVTAGDGQIVPIGSKMQLLRSRL